MSIGDPKAFLTLALLGTAALCGCVSTRPQDTDLKIERVSSAGVVVQSARVRSTKKGVMVSGSVRRAFGRGPTYRSHLDIEIVGPDGEAQQAVATRYIPFPIPRSHRFPRHSDYAVEIPVIPRSGSIIRVSHHPVALGDCDMQPRMKP